MTHLLFHFYRYGEVYMFFSAFGISALLYTLLLYELKKYPNLVLEIRNDEPENKEEEQPKLTQNPVEVPEVVAEQTPVAEQNPDAASMPAVVAETETEQKVA